MCWHGELTSHLTACSLSFFLQMKSVSVKDVDQHKFVRALAAFFKK